MDDLKQNHVAEYLKTHMATPQNMMFFGPSGSGKTSMVRSFFDEYFTFHGIKYEDRNPFLLECHSVDDRGIAMIRGKLTEFVRRVRIPGKDGKRVLAWVWMDDADSLPIVSQQALRRIIENFSDHARFLFCANGPDPFIEPLQSRCVIFQFLPVNINLVSNTILQKSFKELKLTESAKTWMMCMAMGNVRLYVRFLEILKCAKLDFVEAGDIQTIVNAPPVMKLQELGTAALSNNRVEVARILIHLWSIGYSFEDIIYLLEIVCKLYNFFNYTESQRIYAICGEGHIAMIMNKTRLLDAIAIFTSQKLSSEIN